MAIRLWPPPAAAPHLLTPSPTGYCCAATPDAVILISCQISVPDLLERGMHGYDVLNAEISCAATAETVLQ